MWLDPVDGVELFECPVLLLTPEIRDYLQWFELTHQLQGGFGWTQWQRTTLPSAGALDEQPAKLMEALALIAREQNAAIDLPRPRRDRKARKGHQAKRG